MNAARKHYGRERDGTTFALILGIFMLTVCVFAGVFRWYGGGKVRVSLKKTYYFLVRDCEDATVSAFAGQAYLSGGAGYVLERAGESMVVLACYFSQSDADSVRGSMEGKGVECRVLPLQSEEFVLTGEGAGEKELVESNARTVETCARVLYEAANGLDRFELTQEEARAAVSGVTDALGGLVEGNGGLPKAWNLVLSSAQEKGRELGEGILFAKDLRYLQTGLLLSVLYMGDYFT